MTKQTIVVLVAAIVLLGLGIVGAMAFTGGSDSPTMKMPDGNTMPSDQMTSTGTTHTMTDGQTMTGMDMNP